MRAVVLHQSNAPLHVASDHVEPVAAPGGLVLDVTACGVCHSDIHVADGEFGKTPPIILGHEVTGTHPELGPVMLYAPWGCKSCVQCEAGLENLCSDATEAGLFIDGGYAERIAVPDVSYLEPLDGLDPFDAAPLACGGLTAYRAVLQGLDRLREVGPNARALVIGAGGLGQYALRFLRLQSDAHVTALDLNESRRATALEIGAHEAVGSVEDGPTYDLIIDFIGADSTLQTAAERIGKLGVVSVVGLAGGTVPVGFGAVPHEAKFVVSVWGSRGQMTELLSLARSEPSVVRPVEVLALADAQIAHDRLRSGDFKGRLVLDIAGDRTP